MYIGNYKSSRARNLGGSDSRFSPQNAQKLTYMHLQFQKFFPGDYTPTPVKTGSDVMGREIEGEEGKGGESCVPNDFSFRCAAPAQKLPQNCRWPKYIVAVA
jgi:hypothetical protein